MEGATLLLILLPAFVSCGGEGNIHILEEEVAVALKACYTPNGHQNTSHRQRRSEDYPRLDSQRQINDYGHEIRNATDLREQNTLIRNTTDDYVGNKTGAEKNGTTTPQRTAGKSYSYETTDSTSIDNITEATTINRTKRSEPLFNKDDSDQCLSQCVFANLQVVDNRGIPREAEIWNKIQSSLASQQSRVALKDQIRACFQELQSETEDNGCSYSNKLERCLMLRFSDRKTDGNIVKKANIK
uniref:Putative odorant binding protein 10 n=1 Tax=Corcyra cephalonica TaxID=139036 RepID=A0A8K1P975_CORCP|nr:putative odorant binding protein 10 [Corcyra cephalonica]